MALILNIETSTEVCSVSLAQNGNTLFKKESKEGLNHSRVLTIFIEDLFKENNIQIKTIDVILELFNFKFEDFEKSYSRCFFKKIRDFELILNTFKDERLLHIIYYFCALVILNFNEKSNTEKTNLEEEIFTRIE